MTSHPGTAREEHLHPLIAHKKNTTWPSFTSSPDSKLKPYTPSRISKIDFYFFLNRADWGEKVGLMSLIGAEKQHTGLRQQIPQPLPYAESVPIFLSHKKNRMAVQKEIL